MFSRRLTTEAQPRRKNGQPHHSTTGVARASSSQTAARGAISAANAAGARSRPIANASSGNDSATPTQNRRVMSRNSGLAASPADGVIGSSAMPQIGQLPGPSRTICGCIGQVHEAAEAPGGAVAAGSGAR